MLITLQAQKSAQHCYIYICTIIHVNCVSKRMVLNFDKNSHTNFVNNCGVACSRNQTVSRALRVKELSWQLKSATRICEQVKVG